MSVLEKSADLLRRLGGRDPSPKTAAIIVSAGNSLRMGINGSKQFLEICGKPVLAHTLLAFQQAKSIDEIIVVARREDLKTVWELAKVYHIEKLSVVTHGGETRAESVRNGFKRISKTVRFVAIHDGARCLIRPDEIDRVCRVAYRHRAATAACAVTDTVKLAKRGGFIEKTLDRDRIFLVQTPQVFSADLYRAALSMVNEDYTDDNQLMEKIKYPVKLVDFGKNNLKITHPDDLARAEFILSEREKQL